MVDRRTFLKGALGLGAAVAIAPVALAAALKTKNVPVGPISAGHIGKLYGMDVLETAYTPVGGPLTLDDLVSAKTALQRIRPHPNSIIVSPSDADLLRRECALT